MRLQLGCEPLLIDADSLREVDGIRFRNFHDSVLLCILLVLNYPDDAGYTKTLWTVTGSAAVFGEPFLIKSAAFSAIIVVGALVLPPGMMGITEASTTRRPSTPWTRNSESTTDVLSLPILQVPTG